MDDASIQEIVNELAPLLIHRIPGKIFQLGRTALAIDFGLRDEGYLFMDVDPSLPRIYLIKRRVRDLERQSIPLNQFGLAFKKNLANTRLISLEKVVGDRVVKFSFAGEDELGEPKQRGMIAQLTGRSANIFLVDADQTIIQAARPTEIPGQRIGERYSRPSSGDSQSREKAAELLNQIRGGKFSSASEAADAYFTSLIARREQVSRVNAARAKLRREIAQQEKLLQRLQSDLASHANAEENKRIGDLLLANLSTAQRKQNRVKLIDYFSEDASSMEIELDDSVSLSDEAQRRFDLYRRSKRATGQITSRIEETKKQLAALKAKELTLEVDLANLPSPKSARSSNLVSSSTAAPRRIEKSKQKIPGTRRYVSSDGFEILVGRASKDNDYLTMKVAKPNDLWLHAADYGGSHVVVRNPTQKEVPQRTLIEAAQLAAYFSQAKKDPKVDVHYTERKFVTKPKGAKPGLVRVQRSKNITVAPKETGTRE